MVNDLCQSFCFITWQHLLRGSFLSSTLLMNRKTDTDHWPLNNNVEDRKLPLNRCCQVIKQKDWHRPLTINNEEDRKLPLNRCCQDIKQKDFCFITWQHLLREASYPPHCYLMGNGLWQSFCFITWQHLLRGSFISSTLLMVNGLCQSFWDRKLPLNRCCQVIKQKDWHRSLTIK
jgi:hypothetical protein